jgi:endonuclease YncB( thermonuclease family)
MNPGRAVAEVRSGFFPLYKYMDEEMLKAGLAEVYQGSGAVYGFRGKAAYLAMQEKVIERKKGMWAKKDRESAAEFKARMKSSG